MTYYKKKVSKLIAHQTKLKVNDLLSIVEGLRLKQIIFVMCLR